MKVLITGGMGFIGSNFIRYLLRERADCEVVNFDVMSYGANADNVREVEGDPRYSFIRGDISDPEAVGKAMRGARAVINFAAETHVDRSIVDAGAFIRTNVGGVHVLLEAARKAGIERFLHISTDEVYGSVPEGSSSESDALAPNNPYSASKAGADLLVRSYHVTHGMPVLITRSSNNFGPYQFIEKVIPLFITNGLGGRPLPLYGDGRNVRDWLYVVDNCRAIDLVFRKGRVGEIYNVGGGNEIRNIDLTKMILSLLGGPESLIKRVKDRPGHDLRYSLNCDRIKKELGWKPRADFREALAETVRWYRDNRWWWEK